MTEPNGTERSGTDRNGTDSRGSGPGRPNGDRSGSASPEDLGDTAAAASPGRTFEDIPDIDDIDDSLELREVASWMREELVATRIDREEHLEHLLRLKAEFDNYRKRMLREQSEIVERAAVRIVEALLPALDSFDLAIDNADGDDPLRPGMEAVRSQIVTILEKEGLDRVAPEDGTPFDPAEQEPVAHSPGDGGEQRVTKVLRPGYRLKGRLLRPAMVEVSA